MSAVSFASEQTKFTLTKQKPIVSWLDSVAQAENRSLSEIAFVFCSDDYLLDINQRFLAHDYYTDVITFDYSIESSISGDVFVSIDRVAENAAQVGVSFENELHRVLVHGVLHLLGYKDKTSEEKAVMTDKEDFYLSLRAF